MRKSKSVLWLKPMIFLLNSLIYKQIQICTLALTHHFSVLFLYPYSSKFKSVLGLKPMIFLLISFIYKQIQICTSAQTHDFFAHFLHIQANPNLYFGQTPTFFCLFSLYRWENPNLYFGWNPWFFCSFPLYISKSKSVLRL